MKLEEVFVVNKSRHATSAAASKEELSLSTPIIKTIINNIAKVQRATVGKK